MTTDFSQRLPRPQTRPNSRGRAAFTLIELVVVIVIIGVLATLITPRVLNVGARQAEQEAVSVQRLLTTAAEKTSGWAQTVAIDFSSPQDQKSAIALWALREDVSSATGAAGSSRVRWIPDPLVEPVRLDRLRLKEATVDGQRLPASSWRIALVPGQPRPLVRMTLELASGADAVSWTITLEPDATSAVLGSASLGSSNAPSGRSALPRSIDLDDSGRGTQAW